MIVNWLQLFTALILIDHYTSTIYHVQYFLSLDLTNIIMSRSGARDVAPIWQVIVYLDSEYQDQYASIADTLGETSQLENDFPLLELEKGDVLLTVNDKDQKDQDVRYMDKSAIRTMILNLTSNIQDELSSRTKEVLAISYVKAEDFIPERHFTSAKVIVEQISFGVKKNTNYSLLSTACCYQQVQRQLYQVFAF